MRFFKEFIQGLHILEKYETDRTDLGASHDKIYVCNVNIKAIPVEEIRKLAELGFYPGDDEEDRGEILQDEGFDIEPDDFDIEKVTEEQWNCLKEIIDNDFYYYT